MILRVQKSNQLTGTVSMPRSKTHSFRALILASLADGTSTIRNPKISTDWQKAVAAMTLYGAEITEIKKETFQVKGVAGKLNTPNDILDVKNSGTMLAYLMGVAGACPGYSIITGDSSIRNLRKISKNTMKPFQELGVEIISTKKDGMAPFVMKGPV
ncbi:3-phosphoshikimate 1-carboxyvinyltransferase, partial [Candidatus Woesebacteria bacterium]|nr:3-phosphoshikimate 1-carboxyvinyltransferase [Candidatus Woesebacteria bacterium]